MLDTIDTAGIKPSHDAHNDTQGEKKIFEVKSNIHIKITEGNDQEGKGCEIQIEKTDDAAPTSSGHAPIAASLPLRTALETRSTTAVIEALNSRKLHPKKTAVDRKASVDSNGQSSKAEVGSTSKNASATEAIEPPEDEVIVSESDDDDFPAEPTESQVKAYEKAVLQSYVRNRVLNNTKDPKAIDKKDEDKQSVRWLVNNSGTEAIISSPREYQVELFERAKDKNIIAVLDTGSGKTLIAVLLLRHVIDQELERRAAGEPKRISFFLLDSVALVFQQYAVLNCNLNQPMGQFCGDMGCDLWNQELWEKHFNDNMVIVCTAQVLYDCLHHSFINMKQINLLIFDEAHHAKGNHVYARIIKDFYASEVDTSFLPKIFGMTASPVDARVDVKRAAAELEALLHCQIATASDASLLQFAKKTQNELFAKYEALPPPFETPLVTQICAKIGGIAECSKPLVFAKNASSELGSWAADHVLSISFTGEEVKKLEARIESKFHEQALKEPIPLAKLESRISRLHDAQKIISSHYFPTAQLSPAQLSSKVLILAGYLRERFERTTDDKCIVFVKQRYTAGILANLFSNPDIGTPHLRVGALVRRYLLILRF